MENARKDGDPLRKSIIDCYVEKDEMGAWKQERHEFVIIPEKKEEFEAKMKEFMELPIDIDYFKLKLIDLNDIKISAFELMSIEPFIDEEIDDNTLQLRVD